MTWLAAYLYYSEPWESFLGESLAPFVQRVLKDGIAERYFFIRYWEQGPHVRLRFFGDEAVLEHTLKPLLEKHFKAYFEQHPSTRVEPEWLKTAPTEQQWFPNNSIQYIPYEQETERYGGPQAVTVGEVQFESSSNAILAAIRQSESWTYERALGIAIQMHLSFAYALGMDANETAEFYSYIFSSWLPMAYNGYARQLNKEEHIQQQEEIVQVFDKQFVAQEKTLVEFHQIILEALQEGEIFEEAWLNDWITEMKQIYADLLLLDRHGLVQFPKRYAISSNNKTPEDRQKFWAIYASYVHMTNNRLGIQNRDEGYLAYLIMKSLEQVGVVK